MSGLPNNVVSFAKVKTAKAAAARRLSRDESVDWWADVLDVNLETLAKALQSGKTIVIRGCTTPDKERTLDIFDVGPGVAEEALNLPGKP